MRFDPKENYTNRQKLLRLCMERGISQEKMNEMIAPMKGHSHKEKEKIAAALIPFVESGLYDCCPRHFYHKTEWYNSIKQNNISADTVRPVVEEMLHYCKISEDAIENINSFLCTGESLRQMYNWLMDQQYVPEEATCIAKASEISATL